MSADAVAASAAAPAYSLLTQARCLLLAQAQGLHLVESLFVYGLGHRSIHSLPRPHAATFLVRFMTRVQIGKLLGFFDRHQLSRRIAMHLILR